ncbi:pyridoxal phosphate-dependent aminotransferase [uncultured Eubacterium sp.]|uniref:pyridoxal phosphate-dependent aminotransferase n=1 Tax=uncultured Eubacterium sp. TaxID=165185 RepID=UPI0026729BD3|nr:pyridoxal phosphate-dependent aminotransferase [uncultured Eubacterium sp.]
MYTESLVKLGKVRSEIREIFEYGNKRKAEIGADKVFDFSIGNPSVPAPKSVDNAIIDLVENFDSVALHGYTSAQGDGKVRETIANYVNKRFGTDITANNIYMTCGAAASLTIVMNAIMQKDDECIVFTPYFPEYGVFLERTGAKLVAVDSEEKTFQIDIDKFEKAITEKTKAVIINSPNNPSGVVYTVETIEKMCKVLNDKQEEYGHPIFLITDEPYRELVYDDTEVPYMINYYNNTFVCYSYSKALSLPGERIGYIVVSPKMVDEADAYAAVCGAGRALGYVCAPSLYQRVIERCIDETADISIYKTNRDLLYNALTEMGYECVYPDGAFYLFVKAMCEDAHEFCEKAKDYELLLVPADSFGTPGYVRVSYCVQTKQIEDALPAFEALAKNYK